MPPSAASTALRSWPVTTRSGRAREASAASAAWRTNGLPASGATSLVAPPPASLKRDEVPAASRMAAMSGIAEPRLPGRGDLHQKPPDAHAPDCARRDPDAREHALQGPVKTALAPRAR